MLRPKMAASTLIWRGPAITVPVHTSYPHPFGIGVHNQPASAAEPLDALLVVVLAALSPAPLVVAHHILSASVAHASDLSVLLFVELLDAGKHRRRRRRSGADFNEPVSLRGAGHGSLRATGRGSLRASGCRSRRLFDCRESRCGLDLLQPAPLREVQPERLYQRQFIPVATNRRPRSNLQHTVNFTDRRTRTARDLPFG